MTDINKSRDFLSSDKFADVPLIIFHKFHILLIFTEDKKRQNILPLLVKCVRKTSVFHQIALKILVINQMRDW